MCVCVCIHVLIYEPVLQKFGPLDSLQNKRRQRYWRLFKTGESNSVHSSGWGGGSYPSAEVQSVYSTGAVENTDC